jgi:hypothetical protein
MVFTSFTFDFIAIRMLAGKIPRLAEGWGCPWGVPATALMYTR